MITLASSRLSNCHRLSSSSRNLPLNDSIHAFCHGEPGSMNTLPVPVNRHQSGSPGWRARPVVHPHIDRWAAAFGGETFEHGNDPVRVDRAVDLDRQTFAGELVDDVEHLDRAAIGEGVELEVECPEHVRTDRAHRPDMHTHARQTLLASLLGHTQPFFAPQPPDTLVVHLATRAAGLLRGTSPSPPWSLRGELA